MKFVVLKIIGWTLIALAALALLGWIHSGDAECILDTGIFAQIRMCDPAIVGEPQSWPAWTLLPMALSLAAGIACVHRAKRSLRDSQLQLKPP